MKSKLTFLLLTVFLLSVTFIYAGNWPSSMKTSQEKQVKPKKKKQKSVTDSKSEIKKLDEMPEIISQQPPLYPESAKKAHIEGTVNVKILVSETGDVKEVKVAERKGGNEDMEKSALEAAKNTKFKPGKVEGKPVEAWVVLPYKFKLK